MQSWTWKNLKTMAIGAEQKDLDDQQHRKTRSSGFCQKLLRSSKKSLRRTSQETLIPPTTVWRVVRKRLVMKLYKLQLVQAITADGKQRRKQFCVDMQEKLEEVEFNERLVFSGEATFHKNGKVNRHNVCVWGEENPHATIKHYRDSQKMNVFCAISENHVYGPFF